MSERKFPSFISTDARDKMKPMENCAKRTKLYEHPDMPGKVLRIETEAYGIQAVLPHFKQFLEDIEARFRIPTVHPEYVVGGAPLHPAARKFGMQSMQVEVLTVADKIEGIPADELLEQDVLEPEVTQEFDLLSQRMVAQLRNSYENGGFHCQEFYRYDQFLHDTNAEEGQRLVLVDVEPLGFYFHPSKGQQVPGSVPISIIEALADITDDIVALENKIGTHLAAGSEVADFVETIESNGSYSAEEAKMRITAALDSQNREYLEVFQGVEGILANDWYRDSSRDVGKVIEEGASLEAW